jgi:hypothetical protein
MTIRTPPPTTKIVDADGNLTHEWRQFFDRQVVPTVNTVVTQQAAAVGTVDTTVAQLLLHNS